MLDRFSARGELAIFCVVAFIIYYALISFGVIDSGTSHNYSSFDASSSVHRNVMSEPEYKDMGTISKCRSTVFGLRVLAVNDSRVESVDFDADDADLRVWFKNGSMASTVCSGSTMIIITSK